MNTAKPMAYLVYTPRIKVRGRNKGGTERTEMAPAFIVVGPDGSRSRVMNRNETRSHAKANGWAIAKDIL